VCCTCLAVDVAVREIVFGLHRRGPRPDLTIYKVTHMSAGEQAALADQVPLNMAKRIVELTGRKLDDLSAYKIRSNHPPPPPPGIGGGNAGAEASYRGLLPTLINTTLEHRNRVASRATLQGTTVMVAAVDSTH
jgi:hypothetical protein